MEPKLASIREQLPVLDKIAYFNTGTCGPMPQVCANAMNAETDAHMNNGRASIPTYKAYLGWLDEVRARLALLVGAESFDEIAITHHTTEGMNIILWGIDWKPGDAIVTSTHEHGALLAPFAMLLRKFEVEILYLPFNGEPEHDVRLMKEACQTANVRLLAISHVSYIDGRVFPIKDLATVSHENGAAVLVDGAQSVGTIPVDVQQLNVDFYASPGQKWLCAPEGTGFLYIRSAWMSRIHPVFSGLFGLNQFSWYGQATPYVVPAEGAKRFHTSGFCRQAIYGLDASLRWLQDDIGLDWIFERVHRLMALARRSLLAIDGIEIVTPRGREASLLAFRLANWKPEEVRDELEARNISLRDIPVEHPVVRISIGFFHTEQEIQDLASVLSELIEQRSDKRE